MYEVNPYQGLSIANLSTGVIPGMLQASAPTSMEGSFKSGFDEANAVKDRISKDALSRKLEETFGKMYSPEAKAAQGKLAGYKDAIKGSKDNLKGSQDVIDRLKLELQDEQAKPFQNPEKIAKIKAQLAEVQSTSAQGRPPVAEMGVTQLPNMNMDARMANANAMRSALAGKTQQEIAADPLLSRYQDALNMPANNPSQQELYNAYAAPRQGGLKSVVPGYAMSRDEYMQQGSTNSKIEALKAQLADEEAKPIPYPGKAEVIQAEIAAEQEKIAKEQANVEANNLLLAESEKTSKQLIPQAEVLQALAGTNPEKASAEYLDLIQKQQSSGLAGLKYADELKARDSFSSAARGTGEYAGIYEGGATQAKLDYDNAKSNIDSATRSGRNPDEADVLAAHKAKQALSKFSSTLISSYPSMAQEATTAFGVKALDNKAIEEAMTRASTHEIINGKGGLASIINQAADLSAKIAGAKTTGEANADIAKYQELEKKYNTALGQLDPNAKSALVDKYKFLPTAEAVNKIQDEEIKRDANAAQRSMANANLAIKQQEFDAETTAKRAAAKTNLNAQATFLNGISDMYAGLLSPDDATRRVAAMRLSKIFERKYVSDEAFQEADVGRLAAATKMATNLDDMTKGVFGITDLADPEAVERTKRDAKKIFNDYYKNLKANANNTGVGYDISVRQLPLTNTDKPSEIPYEEPAKKDVMKIIPSQDKRIEPQKKYEYKDRNGKKYKRVKGTFAWEEVK